MRIDVRQLETFLREVDDQFPTPLSHKQDLHDFAIKLTEKATICAQIEDGCILSAVAGYTENVTNSTAYISIVATLPRARGKGYASKLVREFIEISKKKGLGGVHLYAAPSNVGAMHMYERLGFQRLILENEPRPQDAHWFYDLGV